MKFEEPNSKSEGKQKTEIRKSKSEIRKKGHR
jgi:hypothetical protein